MKRRSDGWLNATQASIRYSTMLRAVLTCSALSTVVFLLAETPFSSALSNTIALTYQRGSSLIVGLI